MKTRKYSTHAEHYQYLSLVVNCTSWSPADNCNTMYNSVTKMNINSVYYMIDENSRCHWLSGVMWIVIFTASEYIIRPLVTQLIVTLWLSLTSLGEIAKDMYTRERCFRQPYNKLKATCNSMPHVLTRFCWLTGTKKLAKYLQLLIWKTIPTFSVTAGKQILTTVLLDISFYRPLTKL